MGKIRAIVCVQDKDWAIGRKNGLLFSIKSDMEYFRYKTINKVVAMGYNTLLSLPGSRPLTNRINIVIAPEGVERDDCTIVHTLEEMLAEIYHYTDTEDTDVYICGGAMFYKTMLPYCDEVLVTKVFTKRKKKADVFFPNLDSDPNFVITAASGILHDTVNRTYDFRFITYSRKK